MSEWTQVTGESPIDISDLTDKAKAAGVANRKELDLVESENIRKASVKYLAGKPTREIAPFDYSWFLQLHEEMFCDVWKFAGKTRTRDTNLGIPWHKINSELMQLVGDLGFWESNWPDVLEQAATLHYRAVSIHPFKNGNGRWSRLLANIWLLIHNHPASVWPDQLGKTSEIREEYLETLHEADRGNAKPFIELHRRFLREESD